MILKNNVVLEDHLTDEELDDLIKKYKVQHKIYERLTFIKLLKDGKSMTDSAKFLNICRKTGYNWLKSFNEYGFNGLIPNFAGGKPSKLTDEQFEKLELILRDKKGNYTIKNAQRLIKEIFNVKYTYKQVWVITKKKFKLNYIKPSPYSPKKDPNRKIDLKKTLKL